jgi:hypothetical protein
MKPGRSARKSPPRWNTRDKGIVHRDVKPANVKVRPGAKPRTSAQVLTKPPEIDKPSAQAAAAVSPRICWREHGSLQQKLLHSRWSVGSRVYNGAGTQFECDVTRDGKRILINTPSGPHGASAPPLTLETNWLAAAKK